VVTVTVKNKDSGSLRSTNLKTNPKNRRQVREMCLYRFRQQHTRTQTTNETTRQTDRQTDRQMKWLAWTSVCMWPLAVGDEIYTDVIT